MATGVNYWSSYEPAYKVSQSVWGGEQESSSEEGGGGVTWETQAMEVKGQVISAPDPLTCTDRKQRERMAELQERRRSLQALLSSRLAELRRICLQEAELTGAVPSDFPLEPGEKPPCIRRRGGTSRPGNRKCRVEEEDSQRSKPKKTLFSGALRKHSDSEHNTNTQTHSHHGKRTVHRGCHTDDMVRSESSSTTDSTGQDNEDGLAQCRPLLGSSGSPVQVFYPNRTRRNSVHTRVEHPDTHKPLPLPPSHPPSLPLHPPPPPPRSQDSSSSSGPSDHGAGGGGAGGGGVNAARRSNSSDGLLDRLSPPEEEAAGGQQGGLWVNGVAGSRAAYWSSEATEVRTRVSNGEGGGRGGGAERGRGGGGGGGGGGRRGGRGGAGYSEVLLDYVWGKQQQVQRQQSQPNRPITSQQQQQHLLYNGYSSSSSTQRPPSGAPPTYHAHHADQRRVKVTRTKSCGPFLPVPLGQSESHNPAIQPDPHPHLLPPRPPQLPPSQDAQLEEATRSLHKALALEGLRDWYLRNTLGPSHQNQANGKVPPGATTSTTANVNGGVKGGPAGGGGVLQRRRTTHGVIQQAAYQTEAGPHNPAPHHKQTLPHSATFHGHPVHGRSVDGHLYQDTFPSKKQEVPLRDTLPDQPSPGTLV